jgi:hypothetical protein
VRLRRPPKPGNKFITGHNSSLRRSWSAAPHRGQSVIVCRPDGQNPPAMSTRAYLVDIVGQPASGFMGEGA